MIKLRLDISWSEMIDALLAAEPVLLPEDVDFDKGEDEELVRKLAQKLNRPYEMITGWIESISSIGKISPGYE